VIFDGNQTLCVKCSEFLVGRASPYEPTCHLCDEHAYDAARSVGRYGAALAASVIALKSEPVISLRLADLLIDTFDRAPFYDADLIIPVPLSRKRRIERGFNQAELIAEVVANRRGLVLDRSSLVRTRHTQMHRAAMDRKARARTVADSFEVTRPAMIKGTAIILTDDVLTTGSTASACAETLKANGARKVYVLTLARAANFVA
jgi:ComF family protein